MCVRLIAMLSLAACLSFARTVPADDDHVADARQAIQQEIEELDAAYNRGDAQGVAAHYTETAQIFPPNLPAFHGRKGVAEFNQKMLDLGFKGMESTLTEIEVFGDVAFTPGTMKLWVNDKTKFGNGKFMLLWKKVDGEWLIHRDCGNSSEPAR